MTASSMRWVGTDVKRAGGGKKRLVSLPQALPIFRARARAGEATRSGAKNICSTLEKNVILYGIV